MASLIDSFITGTTDVAFPVIAFLLMYNLVKSTIKDNTAGMNELANAVKNLTTSLARNDGVMRDVESELRRLK